MFKNEKGFTLIEMLVVLMVISLLLLLILPNLGRKGEDVQRKGCDALVAVVQTQVDAYYLDHQVYPDNLSQLVEESYLRENQISCSGTPLVLIDGEVHISES